MSAAVDRALAWKGRLALRDSAASAAALADALTGCRRLVIETAEVESLDISHLQLLVAAQLQAARDNVALEVRLPAGGAVRAALERSGLLDPLDASLILEEDRWSGFAAKPKDKAR